MSADAAAMHRPLFEQSNGHREEVACADDDPV
jgi:hypothetical protein